MGKKKQVLEICHGLKLVIIEAKPENRRGLNTKEDQKQILKMMKI